MKRSLEVKLAEEYDRRLRALPDFIAQFAQAVENDRNQTTILSYLKDYTTFLEFLLMLPEFENCKTIQDISLKELRTVTKEDVLSFLSYLSRYQKTFKKQNGEWHTQWFTNNKVGKSRKLASIGTLFRVLSKDESLGIIDPTLHIEISIKRTRKIKDHLNESDVDIFASTISDDLNIENHRQFIFHQRHKARDLTIMLILAFTGIRISELVQLDIQDVSLPSRSMKVIRKGGDEDIVTIPDEIYPQVSEYHVQRLNSLVSDVLHKDAFFISSHRKRIDVKTVRALLKKYKERSGIDLEVTPHTFRRSFGMQLLEITGDIQLVADTMGHSSTETTRRHYVETSSVKKRSAAQNFSYHLDPEPDESKLNRLAAATGKSIAELKTLLK